MAVVVTKKLHKAADRIQAEWYAHPAPTPTEARIRAYTEDLRLERLVRELVDLLRDNIR